MITRPETVELAKYVLLFTTKFSGSTAQVLEFYRIRWQIELVFKRLKNLVQMGHVPKHDDCSSRPWIYGKLLIALLTQKLIRIGHDISPAAIDSRPQRPPSPWREFSFALRNIQQAIEPTVSLDRVLAGWCGKGSAGDRRPYDNLTGYTEVKLRTTTWTIGRLFRDVVGLDR